MISSTRQKDSRIPPSGIGLRSPHVVEIMAERPEIAWLEVHSENYLHEGPSRRRLEQLAEHYPLSLHGVGLSLGSAERLDLEHLTALEEAVRRLQPLLVSDHLSWSSIGGQYLGDLLPLPYTEEALSTLIEKVDLVQERLGRRILLENPARYLAFRHSTIEEPAFLAELVKRTGCGLLCDVNNVAVSAHNLGFDASSYLAALPAQAVEEIHLAGHARRALSAGEIRIDDHGSPIPEEVWHLYGEAVMRFGAQPTLIEWDSNLPALSRLLQEAEKADFVASLTVRGRHGRAA